MHPLVGSVNLDQVFEATSQAEKGTEYQVTFSMFEIYNERVS